MLRERFHTYDLAGNQTGEANTAGQSTEHTIDALDRLTGTKRLKAGATEFTTSSYGYDAAGNITRSTDGNGHNTVYTVNTWNLPESTLEPVTAQHPSVAERTFTVAYTATGQVASLTKPGNVTITSTYDPLGNLIKKDGSGAAIGTPDPTFDYDLAGRLTRATVPAGANTFSYDDRGNLLSASGLSGTTEQVWDDDGRLASVTTGAGTAEFGYDSGGRLGTATDPATGSTATYQYDSAGRVDAVGRAGGAARDFGYDTLGRPQTDTITKPDGTTAAKLTYGYNDADELTSKSSTGVAGAASHAYSYDKAGRLTSWDNGSATVSYVWDDAGNLIKRGETNQTFNARNQLISSGNTTYGYSSRGSLKSATTNGVTKNYQADAFEQLGTADGTANTYDALNRLVRTGNTTLAYLGSSRTVASAGSWSYTHTPDGVPLGATNGTTNGLAWTDAHTDLIGLYNPDTGGLAGSRSYDPFGGITSTAGADPSVGYQNQYTDPASGNVNMGSRWYAPGTGTFTSRDTIGLDPRDISNANRYNYGAGAPLTHVDPDGHWAFLIPLLAAGARLAAKYGPRLLRGSGRAARPSAAALQRIARSNQAWAKRWNSFGRNITRAGKNISRNGKNLKRPATRGPGRVQYRGPGAAGGRGLGNARGVGGSRCVSSCRGVSQQASRARTIAQRANTRAPRPNATVNALTATQRVVKAGASLWAAANNLNHAIDLGNLDIGGDEAPAYIPELVDEPDANVVATLTEPQDLEPPTDLDTIDDEDCGAHTVNYGTIINQQRTGTQACLTPEMINTGSEVPRSFRPPGFRGQSAGHARGHLLGRQLGGDGKVPSNVVTLFQDPVNNGWMRARYENQVRSWLDAGRNVMYTSKPLYSGSNVIPSGVWITAYSNDGRAFSVAIPNVRP